MKHKTTVLVTGGLGYIGSHSVVELIASGYEVLIVDDLSNTEKDVLSKLEKLTQVEIPFFHLDLRDKAELNKLFQSHKIDCVFHFASSIYVDVSMENPLNYYNNNLVSLLNLLNVMKENEVKNLVFSSSCTVYGQPTTLPISEASPIQNSPSPYGKTKVMSETILRDVSDLEGKIKVISLRYFNPVGAHRTGLIGEKQGSNPKHLFPIIMDVISGKRKELKVFGTDYDTNDGTAVRDYIHVTDVAKAHVTSIDAFQFEKHYQFFNLGSGSGFSVIQIIKEFEKVLGIEIPYKKEERRAGDVAAIWANNNKAKNELGWNITMDLSDMIKSAYNWYLKQNKG